MMHHTLRTSLLFVAVTLAAGTACKKKEEGGAASSSGGTAAKTADKPAAAPVALTWKKIASMGIEVEVAADADVQDNSASSGFPSSTIYSTDGTPTTFIFGAKGDLAESMALSKDFDATKARVQKEMNGFKSFTKEDKAGEGFELLYTGASMMDPAKSLYGVTIRSNAAGLTLDCSTNADSEADREKTIRLCKSIRAAK